MTTIPDQPDGIDPDSYDLPEPTAAAERVREFLSWHGDGVVDEGRELDTDEEPHPLYARDLEVLARLADRPGNVLEVRAELTDEQAAELRARFEAVGGAKPLRIYQPGEGR